MDTQSNVNWKHKDTNIEHLNTKCMFTHIKSQAYDQLLIKNHNLSKDQDFSRLKFSYHGSFVVA